MSIILERRDRGTMQVTIFEDLLKHSNPAYVATFEIGSLVFINVSKFGWFEAGIHHFLNQVIIIIHNQANYCFDVLKNACICHQIQKVGKPNILPVNVLENE